MLEICVDHPAAVDAALACGADRLEVCSALDLDGLTPSPGLLEYALEACADHGARLAVMIRPRHDPAFRLDGPGERRALLRDLELSRRAVESAAQAREAVDGFVFGVLDDRGELDTPLLADLVAAAGPRTSVLHRAFDSVPERDRALDDALGLGFGRILTSGCREGGVARGLGGLRRTVERADGRVTILAGGGVRAGVVPEVARCGIVEFHASARSGGHFDAATARALRTAVDAVLG